MELQFIKMVCLSQKLAVSLSRYCYSYGKKDFGITAETETQFIDGGKANGHPEEVLEKI